MLESTGTASDGAMRATVLRHPTDEDWRRCRALALATIGREGDGIPSEPWKRRMLAAGHSPIRTLMFTIGLEVPYWVSVHLCRHKIGVEHYVSSQRNDRQDRYDREAAPQGMPVTHVMDVDAAELSQMCAKRLCSLAADGTRNAMRLVRKAVLSTNPEFSGVLVPECVARGGSCREFRPCGRVADMWDEYVIGGLEGMEQA